MTDINATMHNSQVMIFLVNFIVLKFINNRHSLIFLGVTELVALVTHSH